MALYPRLLDNAKDRFNRFDRSALPPLWNDTPEAYACMVAVEAVLAPLSDRDVLGVITEIFDRIARAPKDIAEASTFAEVLREVLRYWLTDDVQASRTAIS